MTSKRENAPDAPDWLKEDKSSTTPARVERVVVNGVSCTKDDFIIKNVNGIFTTKNVDQMLKNVHDVMVRLQSHKIFNKVSAKIDTFPGSANAFQVTYNVVENRRVSGGIFMKVGTNDGSTVTRMKVPNLLGRAEKIYVEYEYGTKHNRGFSVGFTKPVNADPEISFDSSWYQGQLDRTWSGYKQTDNGVAVKLAFPSLLGLHTLQWDGVWRHLQCLSNVTSFAVREQAGHSLKSSVKHEFRRDTRDDTILPGSGILFKMSQEFAGLGGDSKFFKTDADFQINKTLPLNTVVQVSLGGGIIKPLDINKQVLIADRLFLGGPLSIRGFSINGVGPHSDGNALGAESYWQGALHLYSPFPFSRKGFGRLFRSHFFLSSGNCWESGNINFNGSVRDNAESLIRGMRLSYGFGVVLNMMNLARLEVNYVVPVWKQQGDIVNPGLQFGIGLEFL